MVNDCFSIFVVLNSPLPAYVFAFFSPSLAFKNAVLRRIFLFYNLRVTIIYSVSGFFTILKAFISYKRFVFAAAFFSSPLKSRIVTVLALRNAAILFSTPTASFTLTAGVAFAALIA